MTQRTRRVLAVITAAMFSVTGFLGANAQTRDYPTKSVTIVVPLAPGTGLDAIARIYAEKLAVALGKPVVIENRPGAALMVAAQYVAKAPPDGHTLLISTAAPMTVNQTLYRKINYAPETDFVPISLYTKSPFVLIVRSGGPNTFADFIVLAKSRTVKPLTYGTPGAGSLSHLTMESMKRDFGFQAVHVPYRNSGQIVTDVVAGHLDAAISETGASLPLIRDGRLKALGISSSVRHPLLPDVPTMAEAAGRPRFEATSWHMLLAPSVTQKRVVERLWTEMRLITSDPDFKKKIVELGLTPVEPKSEAEMSAYLKSERIRWGEVVRKLGLEGSQ